MKRYLSITILTLFILVFALATGDTPIARLLYVLVLVIAGGFIWSLLNLRWLDVRIERRTPRVHVGQPVDERITVRNNSPLPKPWLEVVELTDIPGHFTGKTIGLPGRGFRSWRTTTTSRRRGVYTLGPLRIATGDPFGLFRFERLYTEREQVLVLPSVVPLRRFFVPTSDLSGDGQLRMRSHEISPHVSSVREYVSGDGLNRIHWPSTVRQNKLMVKEFDVGQTSDVWMLLDLDAAVQTSDDEDSTEELVVTLGASISRYFTQKDLPVGFTVNTTGLPIMPPERGELHDARILDLLAGVHAESNMPLADAIPGMDKWVSRNTAFVVITPSIDLSWLEAVGALVHRGVRVAAVLIDGSTFGGQRSPKELVPALRALGVPAYMVGKDDAIAAALDHPVAEHWSALEENWRGRTTRVPGARV